MRMDQVERQPLHLACSQVRRGAPKGSKAPPIVRPILAGRIAIGPAVAREISRRIEDKERVSVQRRRKQAGGLAQQGVKTVHHLGALGGSDHRWIAGQQRRDGDALCGKGSGQGAHHIGEATGLHQRYRL